MSGPLIYALALGACAGVALPLLIALPLWAGLIISVISAAFFALSAADKRFLILCVFAAALLVGFARSEGYNAAWAAHTLAPLAHDKKVTVAGVVSADIDERDTTLHAAINVETINGAPASGTLIAFFPTDTELYYGQRVEAKGALRVPDAFEGDGGNLFNYPRYLQVQGVSAMLTSAALVSSTPPPPSLRGALYAVKHAFNDSLERIFLPPQDALMEGILLGERRGIPKNLERAFIIASLIHIVVLSGHAFTLIADATTRSLSFLPKKFRVPLAGLFVVLFIMMVGATSVALRSGFMAGIGMLARFFNRQTQALRALAVTVAAVALFNPPTLLFDTSFVLSTLATFGLIAFSPTVERLLHFMPERFELRGIATSTLSVQLFILPALLYYTGTLSWVGLPANLLALPVLPWAMLSGFVAGVLGLIPGTAGLLLAFVPALLAQMLVRWISFVAITAQAVPHAASVITAFPLPMAVLLYAPLTAAAVWLLRRSALRQLPSSGS